MESRRLLAASPIGAEFVVNTYTTGDQWFPAITVAPNGDVVIAWHGFGPGEAFNGVYARRYAASGAAQGEPFHVNTYTTDLQNYPSVAADVDGDFVVAWSSIFQDGSLWGAYAQQYDATGAAKGGEFRLNAHTPGDQRQPRVALDAAGNFIAVWSDGGPSGPGVYARLFDAAGKPRGGEFRVSEYTTGNQWRPCVAMTADGDFIVAWQSLGQDGSDYGIFARRYGGDGAPLGDEFRIAAHTVGPQSSPAVATDMAGNFVIAWTDVQDGAGFSVQARRFDATGTPLGEEIQVNSHTTSEQGNASVALDADGDFIVVWNSYHQDGSLWGSYGQRFNASGETHGGEFRVNTYTTQSQWDPKVAVDPSGDFTVTWISFGQDRSGYGVYAQRYALAPLVTDSSFRFNTSPHRTEIAFDEDVSASLDISDLAIKNVTTGQSIPSSDLTISYDHATDTATFSYASAGGVLPDGRYRATLLAAGVTTPNGNALPADYVFDFHFLTGDANGDGRVNLQDFNRLATNFGQSPRDFTQGDFNYDGVVNLIDFNILAGRFGRELAPQSLPARTVARVAEEIELFSKDDPP